MSQVVGENAGQAWRIKVVQVIFNSHLQQSFGSSLSEAGDSLLMGLCRALAASWLVLVVLLTS